MKYMLMMFGDAAAMRQARDPQWVTDMISFMHSFNADLMTSGEFVDARGLADAAEAKTVELVDGQVVVSDGPFAESKEALAGYWILDVADEARAVELASRVVVWARKVEFRAVPDAPPQQ